MKYIFSIVFFFITGLSVLGQAGRYAPSSIKLGADPGTLGYMLFSEKRGFFEAEADIDIDRFFIVGNYGFSDYLLDEPTYRYESNGSYLRLGADINFMHQDPNLNIAFFGLRYASSSFDEKLDYNTQAVIQSETGWPNTQETVTNTNAKASWFEMVTGMKIRVVKQLYMGFTLRYKLFMKVRQVEELRTYYVPGFGKNVSSSAFGFNYYISYRLPFRKKIIYTDENKNVIEEKKK